MSSTYAPFRWRTMLSYLRRLLAMPARIQGYKFALGSAKASAVDTASATYNCFVKLDTNVPTLVYGTETDKDEIGKGNEFISAAGVFPTAYDIQYAMSKYGSAEWVLWSW